MRHLVAPAGDEGDQLVPDDVEASSNTLDVLVVPGRAVLGFLTAVMSLRTLQSGSRAMLSRRLTGQAVAAVRLSPAKGTRGAGGRLK